MGFLERERAALEQLNDAKFCHVGAAIGAVAGVVVGGALSGGGGGGAPDPNPGMQANAAATEAAAKIQQETAREYLAFEKQQYEENKGLAQDVVKAQLDIMRSNQTRADEYANYERETFRPLEKQLIADAQAYNEDAMRERLASQAMADVNAAYANAREQTVRQMARFGINPNSGRFAAINTQLGMSQAADQAGAMNRARTQAEGLGYARMQDAVALGRGLAPNASTAYGIATSAGNAAVQNQMAAGNQLASGYGQFGNMMGQAVNAYGTAGNIYGQEFNARMQGYNAQQAAQAQKMSAIGGLIGTGVGLAMPGFGSMMGGGTFGEGMSNFYASRADGGDIDKKEMGLKRKRGKVSGPGGPVDDMVPALLSDGEYVLPADTTEKLGIKFLDEVVKKTHVPAVQQRKQMAKKAGIRRKA